METKAENGAILRVFEIDGRHYIAVITPCGDRCSTPMPANLTRWTEDEKRERLAAALAKYHADVARIERFKELKYHIILDKDRLESKLNKAPYLALPVYARPQAVVALRKSGNTVSPQRPPYIGYRIKTPCTFPAEMIAVHLYDAVGIGLRMPGEREFPSEKPIFIESPQWLFV